MKTIAHDEHVLHYQETKESDELIGQFYNYLNKYFILLRSDTFDIANYDLRGFLACYMKDKEHSRSLRRAKFHSKETVANARKVQDYLQFKLRNHTDEELFSELVIPLLECASSYKQMGRGFEKYLYKSYKYYLKRHLDLNVRLDAIDRYGVLYYEKFLDSIDMLDLVIEENQDDMEPILEESMELTNPRWISGKACSPFLAHLKPHERYILSKYYYEKHTDKEIARMLPYNPKSIHRMRMRMKKKFMEQYNQGELKWMRI
jgi:DNA-directed RNA polymerase specialized sigma24 family protein